MGIVNDPSDKTRFNWAAWSPVIIFLALAVVFAFLLLQPGRNAATIPSVLIGQKAPNTILAPIDGLGLPGINSEDFAGVTVVNFWASWCGPCRVEHPFLMQMASDPRINVVGINYKDEPGNARRFLSQLGNPYVASGADNSGRTAIEWGVYGMPETFVVAPDGTIAFKHVGPIDKAIMDEKFMPEIERLLVGD